MKSKISLATVILLFLCSCAGKQVRLCEGRVLVNGKFNFTKNEEPLLCGDPDKQSWKDVPLSQTEFNLKNFLRARGYYNFEFELDPNDSKRLIILPGERSYIKQVNFENVPPKFSEVNFLGWNGREIVAENLDEIEHWTIKRLKNIGYACAKVTLKATPETGMVRVEINSGPSFKFPIISYDDTQTELIETAMRRYDAFHNGELFEQQLLDLTASRMEQHGIVSKTTFIVSCAQDLKITHSVYLGQPRLLRIGVGVSTEEFPIGKISWKNTRLGVNASTLSADLYGSQLKQKANLSFEWHVWDHWSRGFIEPRLELKRVNEQNQKYMSYKLIGYLGASVDPGFVKIEPRIGPSVIYQNAIEGPVVGFNKYVTFDTETKINSHLYEVNAASPVEGFEATLSTSSVLYEHTGKTNSHSVSLNGTQLWNIANYDPAILIFGYRFGFKTIFMADTYQAQYLPEEFFSWLGGDENIRGFGRRELPLHLGGALTTAYTGFELRTPFLLPKNFDPFIFTDFGLLGTGNFLFDDNLFWSPGVGIRWQSPIGTVRGSLAHGYSTKLDGEIEHLQLFFSLGKEF